MPSRFYDLTNILTREAVLDRLVLAEQMAKRANDNDRAYALYYEGMADTLTWLLDFFNDDY